MATKSPKLQETIELEGELLNFVSYATYYCRLSLFTSLKIFNRAQESVQEIVVGVSGSTPLIMPAALAIDEIPHESSMELSLDNLLNPKYLAELENPENCKVEIKVTKGKDVICSLATDVQALPIDFWSGLNGNAEMLSAFVRPKLADCQKILAEAG